MKRRDGDKDQRLAASRSCLILTALAAAVSAVFTTLAVVKGEVFPHAIIAVCIVALLSTLYIIPASRRQFFLACGSSGREQPIAHAVGTTRRERIAEFSEKYRLTPRESEVLSIIIDNDCALKEVALDLSISERMVQRYMTSIYQKTGTQSRIGLSLKYFGNYRDKDAGDE